ncbi:MAG: hypothetical protein M0R46_02300 [Candidatus Muirbacterium halophilum]|nr:hypothetical protein [Candidatus Muirbacterium halophilum]MCK9474721.1 hypothetical protein [Candidatus Muirbacterium halophilum]
MIIKPNSDNFNTMLFNRELNVFLKSQNPINWINSYYGYYISYFLKSELINENDFIYIDLTNSFYTFEHFYQFTLVKIFRKFIRTKLKINTIGQLYNFLLKLNFDEKILCLMKEIIDNKNSRVDNFNKAWDVLFLLGEKLKIKHFFIGDIDFFYEDRRNFKLEVDNTIKHIIKKGENSSFNVFFEFKNIDYFRQFIKKENLFCKLSFEDVECEKDELFYLYYGELSLYIDSKKNQNSIDEYRISDLLNTYISKCRGKNQVRYILLLISLSKDNGLTISELSNLMNISTGACGSVLKRIMQIDLIKKQGRRFLIKNIVFRNYILEKDL